MTDWTRGGTTAAGLALVVGSFAGCSGDDAEDKTGPESGETTAPVALTTTSTIETVVGQLTQPKRRLLLAELDEVVDGWMDSAHVAGEWPRTIDAEAWAGFTAGAAELASEDSTLTSASEISEEVDSVLATRRVVRYDVVVDQKRAVGATARVVLDYDTTGPVSETVKVRGRLLLTPTKDGWKIFGYDLTEGK